MLNLGLNIVAIRLDNHLLTLTHTIFNTYGQSKSLLLMR